MSAEAASAEDVRRRGKPGSRYWGIPSMVDLSGESFLGRKTKKRQSKLKRALSYSFQESGFIRAHATGGLAPRKGS